MSAVSDRIRAMFAEGDAARDAGLSTPEDVIRYDDIAYGSDPKWQVLDVYRPKSESGSLPVIISVHGGGWVYGDKEVYQYYCMNLAQRGFAVVNFTYRLAPEYKYPSSLEDTNSVVSWVLEHGQEYGMDTDNIFAVGDSAGAHNLALYTEILTNPEYAAEYSFKAPADFRFRAIALNCGAFHITIDNKADLTTMLMADYLPEAGSEKELELISAVKHVTEAFPPVFVMTCVDDFLKAQPSVFIPELIRNDIPHVFRFYGSKTNRLGHVFHCNIKTADAKLCNDEECDFFRRYISLKGSL